MLLLPESQRKYCAPLPGWEGRGSSSFGWFGNFSRYKIQVSALLVFCVFIFVGPKKPLPSPCHQSHHHPEQHHVNTVNSSSEVALGGQVSFDLICQFTYAFQAQRLLLHTLYWKHWKILLVIQSVINLQCIPITWVPKKLSWGAEVNLYDIQNKLCVFWLHGCMCTLCAPGTCGGQWQASDL